MLFLPKTKLSRMLLPHLNPSMFTAPPKKKKKTTKKREGSLRVYLVAFCNIERAF